MRGNNGQSSRWYQAAVPQKAGRIIAAGMTKEVTFEPVDGPINDRIDDAYRAKYRGHPYLSPDDRRTRPLRDSQGHAARDQRVKIPEFEGMKPLANHVDLPISTSPRRTRCSHSWTVPPVG